MSKLDKSKLKKENIVGKGMCSTVYRYTDGLVVKEMKNTSIEYLEKMKKFYKRLNEYKLNFKTPYIQEIIQEDNTVYVIEPELEGRELITVLHELDDDKRCELFKKYFDILDELKKVKFDDLDYGEIFTNSHPAIKGKTWNEFLIKRMHDKYNLGREYLVKYLENIDELFDKYLEEIDNLEYSGGKDLIHGDYFPKNVFVNNELEISHIIDFSELSLVGDHRVDISGSIVFLRDWLDDDIDFLTEYAVGKLGEEIKYYIEFYKIYYSFLFSNAEQDDPGIFKWCITNLKEYKNNNLKF